MDILKKNISTEVKNLVNKMVELIKEGEKKGGIDLTDFINAQADFYSKLDNYFIEFEQRTKQKKRRLF